MLMKLNKILPIQKCSWIGKYPKISKIVRDLQNSLFINRMFVDSKMIMHFEKYMLNQQKNCEFQILFHQFPKQCLSILEMFTDSRLLLKNVHNFRKLFANLTKMLMSSKNVRKVVKIFTNLKNLVISKNIHEFEKTYFLKM